MKNLTELIIKIGGGKNADIPRYIDIIADKEQQAADEKAAQEEAERAKETAMNEFKRQCALIAREREEKKERERNNGGRIQPASDDRTGYIEV